MDLLRDNVPLISKVNLFREFLEYKESHMATEYECQRSPSAIRYLRRISWDNLLGRFFILLMIKINIKPFFISKMKNNSRGLIHLNSDLCLQNYTEAPVFPPSPSFPLSQSSFEVNTCTKVHKVYIRIFFINLY